MDIRTYLKEKAQTVDAALAQYMDLPKDPQEKIYEAMRYSLLAGGKRLRPILLLLANEICGGDPNMAMPFACAVEMIHTYSLIHDDLPAMDDDALRRGKPTNHKVFGEGIAILAGDALLTKAFEITAESATKETAPRVAEAMGILARLSGTAGMVGGQVIDLEHEGKPIEKDLLTMLHGLKTGALIRSAGLIGAVLAGASEEEKNAIDTYCKNLGMAFQIQDDILDQTGTFEELGKPIGSDEENHKTTFVSLYGIDGAEAQVVEYTNKAIDALAGFGDRADMLKELAKFLIYRKN